MCWIDEADDGEAADPSLYDQNLANYRSTLLQINESVHAKCFVPGYPVTNVLPAGYNPPDEIEMETFPRDSVPLQPFTDAFEELIEETEPIHIIICVDVSTSMTQDNIQPGYGQFLTWLQDNYPNATVDQYHFGSEQWVGAMNERLEAYQANPAMPLSGTFVQACAPADE